MRGGLLVDTSALRGRRMRKSVSLDTDHGSSSSLAQSTSRSRSPSAAPHTPPDVIAPQAPFDAFDVLRGSRGRNSANTAADVSSHVRGRKPRSGGSKDADADGNPAGLDVLSEGWGPGD